MFKAGICYQHGRIMLHPGKCKECRHEIEMKIRENNEYENERMDGMKRYTELTGQYIPAKPHIQ